MCTLVTEENDKAANYTTSGVVRFCEQTCVMFTRSREYWKIKAISIHV